ncbi:hypothetical protein JYT31_00630 [Beggiatoa alba]|nr:hypothetical protein [Beggiatoa alba]
MSQFVRYFLLGILLVVSIHSYASSSSEFPVRKLYPAVPFIELQDFYKKRHAVIIVDVRSSYEFETLRINGALHIPLSLPSFIKQMTKLRQDNPGIQIVVYCNGKTCKKSYKAVQKCRNYKIRDVVVYDAGIMDWAKRYPDEAVLLGRSPVNPARLISESVFRKKLIVPERFEKMLARKDVIVLDIRDRFQREGLSLFPGIDQQAYLDNDERLSMYIEKAKKEKKTLLVYDAAGKQVRWLMYYLENQGLKKYKFMKGGANAYYDKLRKQYVR